MASVYQIIQGINQAAAVNVIMVKKGVYFICDTAVTVNPTAEQIAAASSQ